MAQRKGGIGPLDPIFDVDTAYGAIATGNSPGVLVLGVTIDQSIFQPDPAAAAPIVFDVVFTEAVTGFTTGDVTLSGTAGGTLVGTVVNSGDDINFIVNVTGMTTGGTVIATIAAGVCTATATGTPNFASTSTDNTVSWLSPSLTNLRAWYDASDLSTISLSGSDVTQWRDKSPNGFHLSPGGSGGVSGTRTQNGLNVVDFPNATPGSAASRWMTDATAIMPSATSYTMFVVFVQDASGGSSNGVATFGATARHGLDVVTTASSVFCVVGGTVVVTAAAYALGTWRQVTGDWSTNGNNLGLRQNGAAQGTVVLNGTPDSGQFSLGAWAAGSRAFDGAIAEVIIYHPRLTAPSDITDTELYLKTKWATP